MSPVNLWLKLFIIFFFLTFLFRLVECVQHLSIDWCKSPDIGLPRPDAVFYLCSQKNNERDGFGDEIYERKQFQDKVRSNYELIKEDFWTVKV